MDFESPGGCGRSEEEGGYLVSPPTDVVLAGCSWDYCDCGRLLHEAAGGQGGRGGNKRHGVPMWVGWCWCWRLVKVGGGGIAQDSGHGQGHGMGTWTISGVTAGGKAGDFSREGDKTEGLTGGRAKEKLRIPDE